MKFKRSFWIPAILISAVLALPLAAQKTEEAIPVAIEEIKSPEKTKKTFTELSKEKFAKKPERRDVYQLEAMTETQKYVEKWILWLMNYIVYFSQILATFVIVVGMVKALWIFIKDAMLGHNSQAAIRESRLELGHAFSLGLGFLIGASILKTTAAPNWDDIGKLSVIIAIRTILNIFMMKEINKHSENGGSIKQKNNKPRPPAKGTEEE